MYRIQLEDVDEEEVQSYEKLFSEDEGIIIIHNNLLGPALALQTNDRQQSRINNMSRQKYLENENSQLRTVIDEITRDMEIAKNKLVTNAYENNMLVTIKY